MSDDQPPQHFTISNDVGPDGEPRMAEWTPEDMTRWAYHVCRTIAAEALAKGYDTTPERSSVAAKLATLWPDADPEAMQRACLDGFAQQDRDGGPQIVEWPDQP